MNKQALNISARKINMNKKWTTASRLFHVFVTSGKQLMLNVLCGVLLSGALLAQESEAIQPPQEPQPKQTDPLTHLRQGQPGVYQSFQPCRLVDTRNANGPFGGPKLSAGGTRSFSLVPSGGACGDTLPAGATALAINVTITGTENGGFLTIWPGGQAQPNSSAINWTSSGTTIANAIIVPIGAGGSVNIFSSQPTHVILDVSGYYLNSLETGDQLSIVANNETAAISGRNTGTGAGVFGQSVRGPAGQFAGSVDVSGNVIINGIGNGIIFPDGTTQSTAGGGGGVGGTGTANAVPLWTNGTTLGNSAIRQAGNNVGIGTASPITELDVRGIINYGLLTKLDVANNGAAIVRAADFLFGHPDRRGTPGRALVDGGNRLVVKFNRDWGRTDIESDLIVHGLMQARVVQITGADFAENFDVSEAQATGTNAASTGVEPGMVVAIDPANPGKLLVSQRAYSRHVAGIISGAGGINPGMLMGQPGTIADGQYPVALSGRVYVRADATHGAIKPGDLLTTSHTAGHAMRVTNHSRAQGAIIGKAMTSLETGRGLVLVLVTLQ